MVNEMAGEIHGEIGGRRARAGKTEITGLIWKWRQIEWRNTRERREPVSSFGGFAVAGCVLRAGAGLIIIITDLVFGATAVTRSVIVIMIPQKIPGSGGNNPR
jgi:hypothetical protein